MGLLEILRAIWTPYPPKPQSVPVKPPRRTAEYWNDWWNEVLDGEYAAHDRVRLPLSPFLWAADWFERPSWRRVLVVGCGISTEPALLAKLGYEVVAIDLSEVAIRHITKHPATLEELVGWHRVARDPKMNENRNFSREEVIERMRASKSRGGSLQTRCIDFKEFVADKPFDVIYCPWIWQVLSESDRRLLPQRAHDWLVPGGACLVASQNLSSAMSKEQSKVFTAAGFFYRSEESMKYLETTKNSSHDRQIELAKEDDARAHARLDAGEKMYETFNASG